MTYLCRIKDKEFPIRPIREQNKRTLRNDLYGHSFEL